MFPDADLDSFIDAAVFGAYFNAGECCNAGSRLILHTSLADEVVRRIAALSAKVRVGDPLDPQTQVGAIITPQHLDKITGYVSAAADKGADIAHGGAALDLGRGQFMAPTILSGVTPDMPVAREEVFGPVLSVLTFETTAEAIEIANAVDYGLSGGVWSRDFDTCLTIGGGSGPAPSDEHLHGWCLGAALRRLQAVGSGPRARSPRGGGLHGDEDAQHAYRRPHQLVDAADGKAGLRRPARDSA